MPQVCWTRSRNRPQANHEPPTHALLGFQQTLKLHRYRFRPKPKPTSKLPRHASATPTSSVDLWRDDEDDIHSGLMLQNTGWGSQGRISIPNGRPEGRVARLPGFLLLDKVVPQAVPAGPEHPSSKTYPQSRFWLRFRPLSAGITED